MFFRKTSINKLDTALDRRASVHDIRLIAEADPNMVHETGFGRRTPLHYACWGKASLEVLQYLVELSPDKVKVQCKYGWLPLHNACMHQAPLEVIQYLVEQFPDSVKVKDAFKRLPLHYACCSASVCGVQPACEEQVVRYSVNMNPEAVKEANSTGSILCNWKAVAS